MEDDETALRVPPTTTLMRRVAIKVFNSELTENTEFKRRFTTEALIIAAFQHPNIVTVYASGACARCDPSRFQAQQRAAARGWNTGTVRLRHRQVGAGRWHSDDDRGGRGQRSTWHPSRPSEGRSPIESTSTVSAWCSIRCFAVHCRPIIAQRAARGAFGDRGAAAAATVRAARAASGGLILAAAKALREFAEPLDALP